MLLVKTDEATAIGTGRHTGKAARSCSEPTDGKQLSFSYTDTVLDALGYWLTAWLEQYTSVIDACNLAMLVNCLKI